MTTVRPVALVTGTSSGIGKAASLALVDAGFEVVGTSRHTSGATRRDGVTFIDLDVASDESVSTAVGWVIERFGRIDVLVNNAGIGSAGAAEDSSIAQDQSVFDVNVFGLIRMTKAVLPHMRTQGSGRVINISSVLGLIPRRTWPSTPRPSTRSRITPSLWTTRSGGTAFGCCSSSPATPRPRSMRTSCHPTHPCRSTPSSGTSSSS